MLNLMSKKNIKVKQISEEKFEWKCKYCLNVVNDEYCKVGYIATCNKCKKEYEIQSIY